MLWLVAVLNVAVAMAGEGTAAPCTRWAAVEWSDAAAAPPEAPRRDEPPSPPLPDIVLEPGSAAGPSASAPRQVPPSGRKPSELTVLDQFEALADDGTVVVPDVMGAAGPVHLLVTLNTQVRVQSKSGAGASLAGLGAFWAAVGPAPFDPKVLYDEDAGRFFFVAMDQKKSTASAMLFGVSASSDPTGSWTLRRFEADSADLQWADFPNLAVNSKWVAVTANMFSVAGDLLRGSKLWVFDKAAALVPGALTPVVFDTGFDDTGLGRAHSIVGAHTFGSEETLYFVDNGWVSGSSRYLRLSRLTGPVASPAWSLVPGGALGGGFLLAGSSGAVVGARQAGSAQTLDARDVRVLNAVQRGGALWLAHTGGLPAGAPARDAVFWYQLRPGDNPPRMLQQGIVEDASGGSYFYPSIAVNADGDALLGFACSSPASFASACLAGRSSRDPPGAMQAVRTFKAGLAPYFRTDSAGVNRWGDYTATVVDPSDGRTFWTLQQYAASPSGTDRWGTWWGRVAVSHEAPSALSRVRAFPVPWRPGSGGPFDDASVPGCGRGLVFEDVSPEATIRLYDLKGRLVRELGVRGSSGCAAWDGRNHSGREVASGVYLAEIRSGSGDARATARVAIER